MSQPSAGRNSLLRRLGGCWSLPQVGGPADLVGAVVPQKVPDAVKITVGGGVVLRERGIRACINLALACIVLAQAAGMAICTQPRLSGDSCTSRGVGKG